MNYSKEIQELLEKSRRSLQASKELLIKGYPDFAVSRAYYSMFYCTEALLLSKGYAYSKHSAVIAAFGKEFIKNGKLPSEMHLHLRNAFDLRAKGDYDTIPVREEEAKTTLENASNFIEKSEEYLNAKKKDRKNSS